MLLAHKDLNFLSSSYVLSTVATIALLISPARPASLNAAWKVLMGFQGFRMVQFTARVVALARRVTR
jgi:hypothetical protein